MKLENTFTVGRYENRSGVSSWRVAGWLHGVRIRKNFKTREEAPEFRQDGGSFVQTLWRPAVRGTAQDKILSPDLLSRMAEALGIPTAQATAQAAKVLSAADMTGRSFAWIGAKSTWLRWKGLQSTETFPILPALLLRKWRHPQDTSQAVLNRQGAGHREPLAVSGLVHRLAA
jgi:hypothetical protein